MKPAATRPLAEQDLLERSRYYRRSGGSELAERFFDAAITALRVIEASPGVGSPRLGELIGLLRCLSRLETVQALRASAARQGGATMGRFDEVEVLETLTNRWVGGFELADTGPEGSDSFALRRLSDGSVLPEVIPAIRIRPARSAPSQR